MEDKEKKKQPRPQSDGLIFYGDSGEVNSIAGYDYNDYLRLADSKQKLDGFAPEFRDFVDYIIKITHKIWEEKSIGHIYDTYSNNVVMRAGSRIISGIRPVISGTMQTLHSFPDRRLIGQNVIWSGDVKPGHYLSSHRIMSVASNLFASSFGPATGKQVAFRTTVDCLAFKNRIYEEWLVRDNLWIVKQLGFDPYEVARNVALGWQNEAAPPQKQFGLSESQHGQLMPENYTAADDSIGEWVKELYLAIYNGKRFDRVRDYYQPNAVVHYICDQDLTGFQEIQGMLIALFASFPNSRCHLQRITCNNGAEKEDWDVAVRWQIKGVHEGLGYFGRPSGRSIDILGISHLAIRGGKVAEEWITFDGIDLLAQTMAGQPETARPQQQTQPDEQLCFCDNENEEEQ